mmetsp:Transcript_39702/g.90008  ORF Transcript_39702/g.90008 Transcript_39702/m.90008 type:complete len:223 (+) Transcript_39702:163-831(+)
MSSGTNISCTAQHMMRIIMWHNRRTIFVSTAHEATATTPHNKNPPQGTRISVTSPLPFAARPCRSVAHLHGVDGHWWTERAGDRGRRLLRGEIHVTVGGSRRLLGGEVLGILSIMQCHLVVRHGVPTFCGFVRVCLRHQRGMLKFSLPGRLSLRSFCRQLRRRCHLVLADLTELLLEPWVEASERAAARFETQHRNRDRRLRLCVVCEDTHISGWAVHSREC